MKLHSDTITWGNLREALDQAKRKGGVAQDVYFCQINGAGSRSRSNGYEIQLGTDDKTTGPTKSRRYKNSGQHGADSVYAATWDEWGWFITELFQVDPNAIFGGYKGAEDFHAKTDGKFRL
jgi:hypothetical protein